MENRYICHVILVLNIFILVVSFTGVISAPVKSITEIMKNDSNLCKISNFLYDLEYTKSCSSLSYPSAALNFTQENLDIFLCLGVYGSAYKFCQESNQISFFNPTVLNLTSYIKKFDPVANPKQEKEFCDNLQGFTLSYDKINSYLKPLIENLHNLHKCLKICFDFNDKFKPLCAIFALIKNLDDMKKETTIQTTIQIIETKDTSEETTNIILNENNNEVNSENVTVKPELTKLINTSTKSPSILEPNKKINKNETDVKILNNDLSPPLTKSNPVSAPKKDVINEKKTEEFNKEQNINDLKTSTLSENTQDHYDAGNQEEDIETNVADSNIDDVDDTIQQSRNQNENIGFEQKNLRYPNIRTEDDSHFFTYFTVVTMACIAGYIGYHNKQKILAIVLEGRRSRNNRSRRRPSTANYRKLDCTLEEAVTSQCNANVTHVIY